MCLGIWWFGSTEGKYRLYVFYVRKYRKPSGMVNGLDCTYFDVLRKVLWITCWNVGQSKFISLFPNAQRVNVSLDQRSTIFLWVEEKGKYT